MPLDLERCRRLADPAARPLIEAAAELDPNDVAAFARLRRRFTRDDLADALELVDARRRGRGKFGSLAERMILDRVGVEQASSLAAARVKALRMRALAGGAEPGEAMDLCCGVGGDTMALAEGGFEVTALDLDPMRSWQASHHAHLATGREVVSRVADATANEPPADAAVHLDPDRRPTGRRRFDPADASPGRDWIERLARRAACTAVKLAPGIDPVSLPPGEVQWISQAGRLVQAVLWTGPVEAGRRRATRIDPAEDPARDPGASHDWAGAPGHPPPGHGPGRWAFEADPALERAELLHLPCATHQLTEAHPGLGLLTGDDDPGSPWLKAFEVLARLPWRREKVRAEVDRLGGGIVEVKTRDRTADPDTEQKRLRGRGDRPLCVFVVRLGRKVEAWITARGGGDREARLRTP